MEAYLGEENKLEDYLDNLDEGKLYCREERQFAALLYSVFLKKMSKEEIGEKAEEIVKQCLGFSGKECKITIKNVYFEATLMRDFFNRKGEDEKNRREFNQKLLKFCMAGAEGLKKNPEEWCDELKTDKKIPYNIGQTKAKQKIAKEFQDEKQRDISVRWSEDIFKVTSREKSGVKNDQKLIQDAKEKLRLDIAGMMMHATPDIVVQYTVDEGTTYVKALECKYKSDEGAYKDVTGVERKLQLYIQECIMLFLFGKREPKKSVDDLYSKCPEIFQEVYEKIIKQECAAGKIHNAGVELIRFVAPNDKRKKKGTQIKIEELLAITYCPPEEKT